MILHVDGDAFFASVEQAINPSYKGKPLVAGHDRGIAVAISAEAKKYGITRGMPIYQIKELCPECIIVSSAYEAYQLYSNNMYLIAKNYSDKIERYSIDEVFAEIKGSEQELSNKAYELKTIVQKKLDITVSVGIAPSKTLAKISSESKKPNGATVCMTDSDALPIMKKIGVEDVWGIGRKLQKKMYALGIYTAYDFYSAPLSLIRNHFSQKEIETYKELHGDYLIKVDSSIKSEYKSMEKTGTFPQTTDKNYIYAQLISNVEKLWFQMRYYGYSAKSCSIFLKTQKEFRRYYQEISFASATYNLLEMIQKVRDGFEFLYKPNTYYRTTGISISHLSPSSYLQESLFVDVKRVEKNEQMLTSLYEIKDKWGKSSITSAAQLPLLTKRKQRPYWEKPPTMARLEDIRV
ncbi:MAG: DNA polymerase Y family protein [Candidatus Roizmanbacteria bacterium]